MNSFELNKILGAILGTCLITLALNIGAGAIFAPEKPAKPGYAIAVKELGAAPSAAKKSPSSRSRRCSLRRRSRRARPPPSSARPATPSKRAAPTGSVPISGASSATAAATRRGFNFSAAMKAKGGNWTFEELNKFLTNPRGYIPGTAMTFAGLSRRPAARRRDRLSCTRCRTARCRCRKRRRTRRRLRLCRKTGRAAQG